MSAADDPHTLGRARLSFASQADVDDFVATLDRFERGEIGADQWRAFRLLRGTYGQRQEGDASMIRVKVPQGVLEGKHLHAFADVAERYSRGFAHVTTRQNLQLHFVALADVGPALQRFADVGLTTREACGNSVRNISACPWAGVAADELFDVTPYAEALSRYLLRHPLASVLPRKLKTAFEGCREDHAQTAIHDLAFRAVWLDEFRGHNTKLAASPGQPGPGRDHEFRGHNTKLAGALGEPGEPGPGHDPVLAGPSSAPVPESAGEHRAGRRRGFRVTVGGGTSVRPTSASVISEALPAGEILAAAEAVLRVYHRRGDYQHRQRNRIKYLIKEMGLPAFRAEYEAELDQIRAAGVPPLPFDPDHGPVEAPPRWERPAAPPLDEVAARATATPLQGPGLHPTVRAVPPAALAVLDGNLSRWAEHNVRPQRQPGYVVAVVRLPLGDITASQLRLLADLAASYGDGTVRTTAEQNLLLRWVRGEDVPELYRRLAAAGLGQDGADTLADVVSCPGAESCKLAITRSRGLGQLLTDSLDAQPELVAAAAGLDIKVSGCPNGCSRHHVAGIGFQGSVRRLGDRLLPQYFVLIGGGVDERGASFGRLVAKVPARRGPDAVRRLLELYRDEGAPGESARAFLQRLDVQRAKAALADLERLSAEDALPSDFVDLGDDQEITVVTMEGECSA